MDDGRLRGDGRLGDDFSGGWSDQPDDGREDWQSFRDRVDREWRARRVQASDSDPVREPPNWPTDTIDWALCQLPRTWNCRRSIWTRSNLSSKPKRMRLMPRKSWNF